MIEAAREILVRHSKSKRNGLFPESCTHAASILNPLCGDQADLRLRLQEGRIHEAGFAAKACAICTASASLLAEAAVGWTVDEALENKELFEQAVVAPGGQPWPVELAAFRCFEHLRVNPRRRPCAVLPWLALVRALG